FDRINKIQMSTLRQQLLELKISLILLNNQDNTEAKELYRPDKVSFNIKILIDAANAINEDEIDKNKIDLIYKLHSSIISDIEKYEASYDNSVIHELTKIKKI